MMILNTLIITNFQLCHFIDRNIQVSGFTLLWFSLNLQQKNHAVTLSLLPPSPVGWGGESEGKKAKTCGLR